MVIKTRGIVLHHLKYGDSQMIVDLFTQEVGRLSFICHIPKSAKAKIQKNYFQPLNILEVEFDYRQQQQLQRFKDVRMALPMATIPFDPIKLSISLFLAEFLYHALRDEQRNEALYTYIEHSMAWLDTASSAFANFHLVFMMHLTRFVGFYPNLDNYHTNCLFDLRGAVFTLRAPLHPDFLNADEAGKIRLIMRMSYENMHLFSMNRQQRNRCTEIILHYYRLHVPNFPLLKSLDVLQQLFD